MRETHAARFAVNSHIHLPPNFSAFETVEQAVALADDEDVRVLGASNYYDYTVYREFGRQAERAGIHALFGIEIIALLEDLQAAGIKINDPGNPGKMYICGKGITRFDPLSDEALSLLNVIRQKDSDRMSAMVDRMAELFAAAGLETGLDETAVRAGIVKRHDCPPETVYLQERHIAQAFQEALFAKTSAQERCALVERLFGAPLKCAPDDAVGVQNEIRSHLMKAGKPAYVEETFVGFDQAYDLILALGGIPCYPTLADGGGTFCAFEESIEQLIHSILDRGIHTAEFIPVRNSPEVLSRFVHAMRKVGITVTAGTEHNTRDLLPIGPTCIGGQPIPDDVREIFYEGACVVAAHQHLRSTGQPGYVDDTGTLNPHYDSREERIAAFRELGDRVIRQTIRKCIDGGLVVKSQSIRSMPHYREK